jgi:ABC-type antimicrobial peptide transport system permease subunit
MSGVRGPDISVMNYVVRTASPPADTVAAARQAAHSTHPDLALAQITTLQDIVDGASARMAFTMTLLLVAAAVGLMLGIIGIYGVMSYVVSQRTGEIGVRLALGAEPRGVATSIVRQGAAIAALGVGVGLWMAMMGGRAIASLLYGISPRDPAVLLGATALLICASVLACWLPARRAARLSPVDALRSEG